MSLGPETQSTLTTGSPTPIASSSTIGKPSWRELSTYSEARDISSCSLRVKPSRRALSAMPELLDLALQVVALAARAEDLQLPVGVVLDDLGPGRQQAVEPLLADEPAGGDDDLVVERGAVAADVRDRVGEDLDPRAALEQLAVGLGVALGERRQQVEPRVGGR